MKLKIILGSLFFLSTQIVFAQKKALNKFHYSVEAGGFYVPTTSFEMQTNETYQSSLALNDSTHVNGSSSIREITEVLHKNHLGYHIEGKIFYELKKWSFSLGVGLQYTKSKIKVYSLFKENFFIPLDTFSFSNTNNNNAIFNCDAYLNNYQDITLPNPNVIQYKMNFYTIPLNVHYKIIPNKLSASAGLLFQHAYFIERRNNVISFEHSEINGETICDYVLEERSSNPNPTNVAFFNWKLGLSYQISKQLKLEVGINDFIVAVNDLDLPDVKFGNGFGFKNPQYQPMRITAGISYHFNVNW